LSTDGIGAGESILQFVDHGSEREVCVSIWEPNNRF
jgi:hypothetical protein